MRPTLSTRLRIALVLLGSSLWFLYRMRSAGRAALGPGS